MGPSKSIKKNPIFFFCFFFRIFFYTWYTTKSGMFKKYLYFFQCIENNEAFTIFVKQGMRLSKNIQKYTYVPIFFGIFSGIGENVSILLHKKILIVFLNFSRQYKKNPYF